MVGSYEHYNESSGSIKDRETVEEVRDYQLLKGCSM
jgi:hypothetical protein